MFTEIAITASSTDSTIYVWDIRSGSTLFSFKQSSSRKGGMSLVPRQGAPLQIGSLITAQTDRAALHVYDWRRDHLTHRMLTPEKMVTVASSHQGQYVAAATASGRVYLWHTATGHLKRVFDAHYRQIHRLVFSDDDTTLITAGDDATVNVWLLTHLLCSEQQSMGDRPTPLYSWSDHTLPVTDICIGAGTLSTARVYTSSMDFTVKLWDLATGELLTTFLFPKAVSAIALSPSETTLFAACENVIYAIDLYRRRQYQTYNQTQSVGGLGKVEAVGVHSSTDTTSSSMSSSSSSEPTFQGHQGIIHSLALSFDGTMLISGSEDGNCIVWDVASRQTLRKFESHKGPVTSVFCILRPVELQTGATQRQFTVTPWKPFKRTLTSEEEEEKEGNMELHLTDTSSDLARQQQLIQHGPLFSSSLTSDFAFTQTVQATLKSFENQGSTLAMETKVMDVQNELVRLHKHHEKTKQLHDTMYHTLVDEFITERKRMKKEE